MELRHLRLNAAGTSDQDSFSDHNQTTFAFIVLSYVRICSTPREGDNVSVHCFGPDVVLLVLQPPAMHLQHSSVPSRHSDQDTVPLTLLNLPPGIDQSQKALPVLLNMKGWGYKFVPSREYFTGTFFKLAKLDTDTPGRSPLVAGASSTELLKNPLPYFEVLLYVMYFS